MKTILLAFFLPFGCFFAGIAFDQKISRTLPIDDVAVRFHAQNSTAPHSAHTEVTTGTVELACANTLAIPCEQLVDPQCDMLTILRGPDYILNPSGQTFYVIWQSPAQPTRYGGFSIRNCDSLIFQYQSRNISYWIRSLAR